MSNRLLSKFLSEYGMLGALLLLCLFFSWATIQSRRSIGAAGGTECAENLLSQSKSPGSVLIVVGTSSDNVGFAEAATQQLKAAGDQDVQTVTGDPHQVRASLQQLIAAGHLPRAIISTSDEIASLNNVLKRLPALSSIPITLPPTHTWPTFLTSSNLLNVANQIVVIAVIAVGMTMVIITGGIDLSVGSLVALSAVLTGVLIRDWGGGVKATASAMILCSAVAVIACGLVGAFTGGMITLFRVPPFIITLAMMLVASGRAYKLSHGLSIYDVPATFTWLGRGTGFAGVPYAVLLMVVVYVVSHIMMSRTRLGRYIYAVGGNAEAARLSGVNVRAVLITVYVVSGMAAGIGGVIVASQLGGASPTYGLSYELYVIAAVVVGGTSLSGGEGNVAKTLIGALIIAVIQNGMNLTGIEPYSQKEVLGWVILGAVLLDSVRRNTSWSFFRKKPPRGFDPVAIQPTIPNATAAERVAVPASSNSL